LKEKPELLHLERVYDGYFKIDKASFRIQRMDQSGPIEITRYIFERGDSVGILIHDPDRQNILLVRQFRYPAAVRDADGWLLEIVAGAMSPDGDPVFTAIKEIREETDIECEEPGYMGMVFLSPGGSSERCFMFEVCVDSRGLDGRICGESGTDEEVRVEIIPIAESLKMIQTGKICDAKTVIALQKLALGEVPGW